jgi:signal transduction histidine kinase
VSTLRHVNATRRGDWFQLAIAIGIALALSQTVVQHKPQGDSLWFEVPAVVAMTVPLLAWRRFPFLAPLAVGVVIAAASLVDHTLVYDLAPAAAAGVALFLVGMARERSLAFAGLACAIGVVAIAVHNDPGGGIDDFAAISIGLAPVWLLGLALRRKIEEAESARAQARVAVSDERARIARELHDVVGHALSVMTVQAGAVRRLLRHEQVRERESLRAIEEAGREALAEMRRMVGVLRHDDDAAGLAPQPGLEQVPALVERTRSAGLPVELQVEGDASRIPASVDLTAYRLVQEGLTNALKHSRARHAEVVIRYAKEHIEVTVTDDGRGNGRPNRAGRGLAGMRERVSIFGGELEAGHHPAGGYRLHARLPVERP